MNSTLALYDTHAHPYLAKQKDMQDILDHFASNGHSYLNTIGVDIESSKRCVALATQHAFIYASIGIHPCDVKDCDLAESIEALEQMYLAHPDEVVAIGETGLDYYWMQKDADKLVENIPDTAKQSELREKFLSQSKQLQKLFFQAHIHLARQYNLPLVIHNRDAREDILDILRASGYKNIVFHCYSEDLEYASRLLKFAPEAKISFSGIVTFKNAKDIQETAAKIPLKNILIETDAPYLTPEPLRGREENEPIFVKHVLECITDLRDESADVISRQIFENSIETFGIQK